MDVEDFIRKWSGGGLSERSHYQTFICDLCRVIGAPAPDQDRVGDLDYCFERPVSFHHDDGTSSPGRIDCYRRGSFVLEAKQSRKCGDAEPARLGRRRGALSEDARERLMRSAKRQAEAYAKALDEWPPFLVVTDVGGAIDLWSDFSRRGKAYTPFPDRDRYRITLEDLRQDKVRERLRQVWLEPMSLDPEAHSARVTIGIAAMLAQLVRSIEARAPLNHAGRLEADHGMAWTGKTARFVMQCIFAMFADSVGLLPKPGFRGLLESYRGQAHEFHKGARHFFGLMETGGFCPAIHADIPRFNGGLFAAVDPMPITEDELDTLIAAAGCEWADVEPAIFGSLLEQALQPADRSKLGAHFTPRPFVETLVQSTIMEVLRADWAAVEFEAIGLYRRGGARRAMRLVREFHRKLCRTRVLDPACGTGNILYVAMSMMKDLEGEVLALLAEFGETQTMLALDGDTVSPRQFLGIEINAFAARIAEMVIWIGYLQWHFRLYGAARPSEPILRSYGSIIHADALIAEGRVEQLRDGEGRPALDDQGRIIDYRPDPRPQPWPVADFITGNPPFIGGKNLRRELGDGYVDALWKLRQGRFRSADLVMDWVNRAAEIATAPGSRLRRFGFITTNSITQTFSRRVLEHHLNGQPAMRLVFAVPDHPWLKGGDRADVRIAMIVAERGAPDGRGRLLTVLSEDGLRGDAPQVVFQERQGVITASLTLEDDQPAPTPLLANAGLAHRGVQLMGGGFRLTTDQAARLLYQAPGAEAVVREYCNGRDLAERSRGLKVIDAHGWSEYELRRDLPQIYQHLLDTVRPERATNRRETYRRHWWLFGEGRPEMRHALKGLNRYIVTVETAKHRWFRFLPADVVPDNKLIVVASDDPAVLAVLSSRTHARWFEAHSGRIGVYDADAVYVKSVCFDRFPFPEMTAAQRAELAALGEEVDTLRSRVLADHDHLTMTQLYNACQDVRAGGRLDDRALRVYRDGLVGVLNDLHGRIDALTARAYGWSETLSSDEEVARLSALNHRRHEEEQNGLIRFLRPEIQDRPRASIKFAGVRPLDLRRPEALPPLPDELKDRITAVLSRLEGAGRPLEPDCLLGLFAAGARPRRMRARIEDTLQVLAAAGAVQHSERGWFAAVRRG